MLEDITSRYAKLNIIQFGVGGIGSWLAQYISKLLNNICERYAVHENFKIHYVLIDNDIVESRNVLRQNFLNINIGDYKCNAIFKIIMTPMIEEKISFIYQRLETIKRIYDTLQLFMEDSDSYENILIILGCVDNVKTRRNIYSAVKKIVKYHSNPVFIVYFDGGNELQHGQVITTFLNSSSYIPTIIRNWKVLDNPPNIHKFFKNNKLEQENNSCAFFGDQTMGINIKIAAEMFGNVQRLLIDSVIPQPYIKHIVL